MRIWTKIRSFFSKVSRSDDLQLGRDKLAREMRKHGIGISSAQSMRAVKTVADETGMMVRVANKNTPLQVVISGHKKALEAVYEGLKGNSARAKFFPLAVSGAFHTPMMAEANAEFVKLLDKQDWQNAAFPIYSNVSGEPLSEANLIRNAMRKQMTSSVQWVDTIANMWKNGVRRWIEFGPQGVTSRMVRPILSAIDVDDNDYSTVHIANIDSVKSFEG